MTRPANRQPSSVHDMMRMKIADFLVQNERDVKVCGRRVRLFAGLADLTRKQRANLGKCLTGVAEHLLSEAAQLAVEFGFNAQGGRQTVEIVIRADTPDSWPDELDRVSELVDQFHFSCDEDSGTLVRLGQDLPADAYAPEAAELHEWGIVLEAESAESAVVEIQRSRRASDAELLAAKRRSNDLLQRLNLDEPSLETLNMLSLVANKTDNLVMVLDTSGVVEWVNAAFARMTGYTYEEIANLRPLDVLFGSATSSESRSAVAEALRLGNGVSEELQLYRKDGAPFWAALTVTPVVDESREVSRWIAVGADITKRRQAHEVLERAKQAAEAASLAKSGFLANMSHEIRTPMNAIIGMTELALATNLSHDQREYLTMVKYSADALLELLNDILDLSKVEAGRIEVESVPFNLRDLLTTTLGPLVGRAKSRGLELLWQLTPEVPVHLIGDPYRLRQILLNLTSNAVKFTEQGQIVVKVHNQWESDEEVALHFSVSDTGIGIPADRLDRIFGAFEQADSSTTRRHGGTGLGLAICRELTQLLGGKIWVKSQLGRGSIFHFTVRLSKGEFTTVNASHRHESLHPATATTPLHVLVADDHAANRELAAAILRKLGHEVAFAVNGCEAVEAISEGAFDVVLMDIQMPEMDGFQATTAVRDRERKSETHVPIVALTAHALKGDREKCLAAGMDAYLAKPIDSEELRTLVESLAATTSRGRTTDGNQTPFGGATIEFSKALSRLMGDQDLLKRQMKFFLNDCPKLLDDIECSVKEKDAETLKFAAHRLKGLSASFDAHRAAELAHLLETRASQPELGGCEESVRELGTRIAVLRRAIEEYLDQGRSS